MAVALHSNVELMHASMAIFNARCDRLPVLILGATGPTALRLHCGAPRLFLGPESGGTFCVAPMSH